MRPFLVSATLANVVYKGIAWYNYIRKNGYNDMVITQVMR